MSTYSTSLRAELIANGAQAGTWGDTTNNNFAYIFDTAIAGYQTVSVTASSQALTYVNGPTSSASANQSVYAMLRLTTTTGAAFSVYAPPNSKAYIIYNNSGYTATIYNSTAIGNTTAAGTGIAVINGAKVMIWSDGINFYDVQAQNLTGLLAIANGGTGQTTANAAFNALAPVQTNTVTAGSFIVGATYTILTVGTTNFVSIGASANTVGVVFTATGVGSGTGTATTPSPNRYLKSDGTNTSWDQFSLATTTVTAGSFVIGTTYTILTVGTTSFTSIGASANTIGVVFTATGAGSGTGTAFTADYVGLLPVTSGGTGVTTSTGSGNLVLSTSPTLTTPTLTTPTLNYPTLNYFTLGTYGNTKALFNTTTVTASAPPATTNFDIATQAVQYYTSNATANFTLNFRGSATATVNAGSFVIGTNYTIVSIGTTDFTLVGASSNTVGVIFTATGAGAGSGTATTGTLNSILSTGQTVNCSLLVTNGAASTVTAGSFVSTARYVIASVGTTDFTLIGAASNNVGVIFTATGAGSGTGTATTTGFYPKTIQIDGTTVTPTWQGGPPLAGNISSVDAYAFSIVKTANLTYTVLASATTSSITPIANGGTGATTATTAAIALGVPGYNQTWQTPSRSSGTTYTNSTSAPITVNLSGSSYGLNVTVGGVGLGGPGFQGNYYPYSTTFIVPVGVSYVVNINVGGMAWSELR